LVKDTSVLEFSEVLLELFRMTSLKRFGPEIESFTFHLTVKHLVENVRYHGSLISHSMFSLEGSLGFFNSTLNGNVNLSEQYVNSNILIYTI
jgi:hypothetical protein